MLRSMPRPADGSGFARLLTWAIVSYPISMVAVNRWNLLSSLSVLISRRMITWATARVAPVIYCVMHDL